MRGASLNCKNSLWAVFLIALKQKCQAVELIVAPWPQSLILFRAGTSRNLMGGQPIDGGMEVSEGYGGGGNRAPRTPNEPHGGVSPAPGYSRKYRTISGSLSKSMSA